MKEEIQIISLVGFEDYWVVEKVRGKLTSDEKREWWTICSKWDLGRKIRETIALTLGQWMLKSLHFRFFYVIECVT